MTRGSGAEIKTTISAINTPRQPLVGNHLPTH
uniref:Uncharacterized protein n=1 Tax=Anguilla anguilla TaxID=7936 RepID=A0A0E9SVK5_ANGAN